MTWGAESPEVKRWEQGDYHFVRHAILLPCLLLAVLIGFVVKSVNGKPHAFNTAGFRQQVEARNRTRERDLSSTFHHRVTDKFS
jgi:hypothetical protein